MVATKTDESDLVTVADRAAEAAIRQAVSRLLPGVLVLGEEAVADEPSLLDRVAAAPSCVIVDPIDGTWNYARGLPMFGVILAVVERGETVFGLLYDPMNDDWIFAHRGEGAFYQRESAEPRRCRVAPARAVERLSGALPLFLFDKAQQRALAPLLPDFARVGSLRCSCHEYRLLSEGSLDFCLNGSIKPWDHAAGILIHAEAGGYSALLDGAPYNPGLRQGHLLVASSPEVWAALRDKFAPVLKN
jgi:fructose-1,6-bisphosphatase/inositol monophosphatase family enzyme